MGVITRLYLLLLKCLRYGRAKPPTLHIPTPTPSHLTMPSPAEPTLAAKQLADAIAERDRLIDWITDLREEYTFWHTVIHDIDEELREHNSVPKHGWTQAQTSEWEMELADLYGDREYYAKGLVLVREEWTVLMKDLSEQWPLVSR